MAANAITQRDEPRGVGDAERLEERIGHRRDDVRAIQRGELTELRDGEQRAGDDGGSTGDPCERQLLLR
jgi:hypothetical protein